MDGRRLTSLNIVGELNRVRLAIPVRRECEAGDMIDAPEGLLNHYPVPTLLRIKKEVDWQNSTPEESRPLVGRPLVALQQWKAA